MYIKPRHLTYIKLSVILGFVALLVAMCTA